MKTKEKRKKKREDGKRGEKKEEKESEVKKFEEGTQIDTGKERYTRKLNKRKIQKGGERLKRAGSG